ncbi:hypothetical protein JOF56_008820 [Kibdelosporangium banguiense]|uniref:Pyrrolo-quinoline quinone repeat domain-containing protein n=1 Tax=Kibdelosporangium banguiense TaxID=1365924 RepID=A0ABS4TVK6_9PSEU|nr:PQQ-binding-like beta-propeller repeat protein [Kibdelosporangium banguiense]MBP2328435.1 hypothetical protein [Kibdelosporangium banguiense]
MSSIRRGGRRLLIVLTAGFAAACTGDHAPVPVAGGASAGESSPAGTSSPAARYDGPELPGLARQPAWSLAGDHAGWKIFALGDAAALVYRPDASSTPTGPSSVDKPGGDGPDVIEFRDSKSGEVRKSVRTTVKEARQGIYNGKPVLYVYYQKVTPSDGLSAEKRTDVREAYDANGTKVMSVAKPVDEQTFAVADGWVVSSKKGDPALTISDVQDKVRHRVDCGGDSLCAVQTPYVVFGSTKLPAVVGNLGFQAQPIVGSSGVHALRVVATNLETGQQAWSTATMDKPSGAAAETKVTGAHATPIRMIGGKLLLAWYTERSDGFGERGEILALHDPATGKLLITGPELGNGYGSMVIDDGEQTAVVTDAAHDARSLAWELGTGRTLWRQEKSERGLQPQVIAGDVLYGLVEPQPGTSTRSLIAVDLKTKTVRENNLKGTPVPVSAGKGYVAVSGPSGLFAFPTAS